MMPAGSAVYGLYKATVRDLRAFLCVMNSRFLLTHIENYGIIEGVVKIVF